MKISERDIKILKFGSVLIMLILIYALVVPYYRDRKQLNADLARDRVKVAEKSASQQKKNAEIAAEVPFFEMPHKYEQQKLAFREKLNEQLKKCGIVVTKLDVLPMPKKKTSLGTLRIKCQGKCQFKQFTDLMAKLYENPYFVAVEELKLDYDSKNRKQAEISMVVSTFVKR